MPTLNIEGVGRVRVDDSFTSMSPEEQSRAVDEIASSMKGALPTDQPETGAIEASNVGVLSGLTGNFGDEIMAGAMTPIEMGMQAAQGEMPSVTKAYGEALRKNREYEKTAREEHPVATTVGDVAGGLALGGTATKGGLTFMNAAKPTAKSLIGRGAAEGAAYGSLYGAGAGEGVEDRLEKGVTGAAIGGAAGGAMGALGAWGASRAGKKAIRSIDELTKAKQAAYKAVDNSGARYSQGAFDNLVDDIGKNLKAANINPDRHPKAASMLQDLIDKKGSQPTLTELDQIRQVIRRDVANASDEAERFMGGVMMDTLDDFVRTAGKNKMAQGSSRQAARLISKARKLNTQLRKAEMLQDAMVRAERRASSTGSGGNVDNAIRQNIRHILDNPKKVRGFSKAEREALEKIVRGGRIQNLLRLIGKLSPQGSGLMTALSLGSTAYNPLMAIPAGTGIAAKSVADRMTPAAVNSASQLVRSGGQMPGPALSPARKALIDAAIRVQAQKLPPTADRIVP